MSLTEKYIVYDHYLRLEARSILVGSPEWFNWLLSAKKFSYKDAISGSFIAQSEIRRNKTYWYAYRRREGKLFKVYLGKNEELSMERLQQAGLTLQGHIGFDHSAGQFEKTENQSGASRIDHSFMPMTKVNGPLLPHHLITRKRLIEQMNTPLVIIYAPSGFGKSTLINEWKQSRDFPVAWISLDENDNIPARFWQSVIMAFEIIVPNFGRELHSYITGSSSVLSSDAAIRLTNDVINAQKMHPYLGLVLDDFRYIHNTEIYDAIQAWIEHFPSNMQLVLSGYTRPPLALGHLRAKGMLNELDASDLRFTTEEGIYYLKKYQAQPRVAYGDLEKLVKHTEGWASGLTLAAMALGKQEDHRHFVDTFSGAHIYLREYFMETILRHTPSDVQIFLLKTAILKHLTGSLCDAVTGLSGGEEMLSLLWRENLFITRLDEQGWYRYHDLFAEMLYSQLQTRFPGEVSQLHQRAAQWYREQFTPADAIYHLLSMEAWEEAATLIEDMALRELEQFGEDSRLLNWLQELPDNVFQKHKTLLFVYLRLSLSALPIQKIEKFVQKIELNISNKPAHLQTQEENDVLFEIRQIQNTWAKGQTFLPPISSENENDLRLNLLNNMNLLKNIYAPDAGDLIPSIHSLFEDAQKQRNLFVILLAGGVLARNAVLTGQLRKSEKMSSLVLDQAIMLRGSLPQPVSITFTALSHLHLERNEIELAQQYLDRVAEVDPNPVSTNIPVLVSILRAKIQVSEGQADEARATMQAIRNLHIQKPSGVWSDDDLLANECLICIRCGDFEAAKSMLPDGEKEFEHCLLQLVQAKLLMHQGNFESARKILNSLLMKNPLAMVTEPIMVIRVALAVCLFRQFKVNQSIEIFTDAIRQSASERFFGPYLEAGSACIPMLALMVKVENLNNEAKLFVRDLIHMLGADDIISQFPKDEMENLTASASVSMREHEVLKLINLGYTNKKIAEQLCISESTAKTHIGNIYAKLRVNNRIQAIVRAKEYKLIK